MTTPLYATIVRLEQRMERAADDPCDALLALAECLELGMPPGEWNPAADTIRAAVTAIREGK